jgi:hypothetical protein
VLCLCGFSLTLDGSDVVYLNLGLEEVGVLTKAGLVFK